MTEHVDAESLAGLDDTPLAVADRDHLLGCALCTAQLHAIARTHALLAALPAEPMPADVLAGLDRAIAAEAAHAPNVPDTTRRVLPLRLSRTVLGGLSAAAALALIAGGVGLAVAGHHGGGSHATSSGAGAPARAPRDSASRVQPRTGRLGGPDATVHILPPGSTTARVASGLDYHHATLASQAQALRTSGPAPGTNALAAAPTPGCLAGLAPVLRGVHDTTLRVRAVDTARYDGVPALVIVLTGQRDPAHGVVAAVAANCSAQNVHLLDQVVLEQLSARP